MEGRINSAELKMSIIDQGEGIDEANQARLFTKFFRVDNEATRSVGGTGLGLSITKGIIETHGGTISMESKLGQGTKFTFTMPTAMPKVAPEVIPLKNDQRSALGSVFQKPSIGLGNALARAESTDLSRSRLGA